jgi:inorganic pyrophosphatase
LIAVAGKSIIHRSLRDLTDLPGDLVWQIEHFFISYNAAKGKAFTPTGRLGADRARALVHAGSNARKPRASQAASADRPAT